MKDGKVGTDGIPAEVLKHLGEDMQDLLYDIITKRDIGCFGQPPTFVEWSDEMRKCWQHLLISKEVLSKNLLKAELLIALLKKGKYVQCSNYINISILWHASKILRVIKAGV